MENKKTRVIEIPALSLENENNEAKVEIQSTEVKVSNRDDNISETKVKKKSIYDILEDEIMRADTDDIEKTKQISKLLKIRGKKVNILLVGATGSGKSSTINALFNMEVAKVGVGVDPETDRITKYDLENLTIWDSPGLGDGVENDEKITKDIIKKLNEMDDEHNPLIDIVIVILDASSKDLSMSYNLINKVIIPCIGEKNAKERILLTLNQADVAMKGNHWNSEKNEPDDVLKEFLDKKAESVRKRIKEGTGLDIMPIYYCAGYKEDGGEQRKPYNLTKLLYYTVKAIPKDKRLAIAENINNEKDNWNYDDKEVDYIYRTTSNFSDTVWDCIQEGANAGVEVGGAVLGVPGAIVGGIVGSLAGTVSGFFSAIFG
jgi:Predicted GTPase